MPPLGPEKALRSAQEAQGGANKNSETRCTSTVVAVQDRLGPEDASCTLIKFPFNRFSVINGPTASFFGPERINKIIFSLVLLN